MNSEQDEFQVDFHESDTETELNKCPNCGDQFVTPTALKIHRMKCKVLQPTPLADNPAVPAAKENKESNEEVTKKLSLEKSNELSFDNPPGAEVITFPSTGSKSSFNVPPIIAGCLESCSVDVSILDKPRQHAGMVSIKVGLLWVKRGFIKRLSRPDQSFASHDFPGVAPC